MNDGVGAVVLTATTWEEQLGFFMRTPTNNTISQISQTYSQNLTVAFNEFAGDAVFKCHSYFLASAFRSHAYKYYMSVPPATHGQDQFYYWYTSGAPSAVTEPDVARGLQQYFRNFVLDGKMGGPDCGNNATVHWPAYGKDSRWMNITSDGFKVVYGEHEQASRCEALLNMINDPANGW